MKLIRFGELKKEKPGILLPSGERKDLSAHFKDWNSDFFLSGGLEKLSEIVATQKKSLPGVPEGVRWGACVARPGKVVCVGLNYIEHIKESGMALPKEPVVFMKASSAIAGPYDNILIPRGGEKTDWEVELALVLGKDARYLNSPDESAGTIAGFCIANDVSERHFQLEREGQWSKGKSCDTFCPLGPYLATPDEIPAPMNLHMSLKVNGRERQSSNTRNMIFNLSFLVHYLSQFMTLEAGDVVLTGTPPGVGLGLKPPEYLKAGDTLALSVEGLGEQRQTCAKA